MDILFADDLLLAIDKPAGLPVLPDGWTPDAPFVLRMAEAEYGKLWVVHRLDKSTSGVLVLARNAEAHRALSLQFEKHEAEKVYHALANGNPPWKEKTAKHPLRANVGHKHRTAIDNRLGKPSRTEFAVLAQFAEGCLLEARPATGRTHQIRAHAAALGLPLLGDVLYGAPPTQLIGRPALHAFSLTLHHPGNGEPLQLTAEYPEDFRSALVSLKRK